MASERPIQGGGELRPSEPHFLLSPDGLCWALERSSRMCWKGESAGLELRTLAAAQGPPLMFFVMWTNYLSLWRFNVSICYLRGGLKLWFPNSPPFNFLNVGQHFFPRKFYMDLQFRKQNCLVEVVVPPHPNPIHSAFPARPLPEAPWEPAGTLGSHRTQFENCRLCSQRPYQPSGQGENLYLLRESPRRYLWLSRGNLALSCLGDESSSKTTGSRHDNNNTHGFAPVEVS